MSTYSEMNTDISYDSDVSMDTNIAAQTEKSLSANLAEHATESSESEASKVSFITLPTEIRLCILEHALVMDKPIDPTPASWTRNHAADYGKRPCLALFRVNKAVSAEALEVYYSKNIFYWTGPHVNDGVHANRHFLRDLVVEFSNKELIWQGEENLRVAELPADRDLNQHIVLTHDIQFEHVCEIWSCKSWFLDYLPRLRSLHFNMEDATCFQGCCQATDSIWGNLPLVPIPNCASLWEKTPWHLVENISASGVEDTHEACLKLHVDRWRLMAAAR